MATSDPYISLSFQLRRSTWEYLLPYLEQAGGTANVDGSRRELNIEVWNTANGVRNALQTVMPEPVAAASPDWLQL